MRDKLTTQLVRENQTIVVENLAVKNMVKNPKLSQAISDVSWGEITRQLAYKCRWYGRNYIEIDRWFPSSKRCSNCGYIAEKMPLNLDFPRINILAMAKSLIEPELKPYIAILGAMRYNRK
ncbi:transposase [Microcystis aeruginosa NIES-843]|uniref:Transposase n=1 Tax=Microcystis aeruginosa (strain NIES-843 / IAM M-2473) TaxID=449447 RepID=B0JME8_MICAN|nr:transposase [Microcystis aeruginosa NIES-843]